MLSLEILLMLLELTVFTTPTQIVESLETTSLEMKCSQDKWTIAVCVSPQSILTSWMMLRFSEEETTSTINY